MPIFSTMGSYIWPSHFGQAIWATTPAFFFSLFAGLRNRRLIIGGAVLLAISALVMIFRSAGAGWGLDGVDNNFLRPPAVFDWIPEHLNPIASWHLLPFWALIAIAVAGGAITAWRSGFKDRLVIACWAAIIPIALNNFLFAATGWAQFGYRYGLDFYPFLFLLVVKAVGNQLRWYHMALIVVSIVINLWGVLWIYQFDPAHLNDWTWVSF